MLPKLYDEFLMTSQGYGKTFLGTVNHCKKCLVTEKRNGAYTLELETTVNDDCAGALLSERILKIKPNPFDYPQCFEIQNTTRRPDGIIRVRAKHIKSNLFNICTEGSTQVENAIASFTGTPSDIWDHLHDDYIPASHPFTFSSNIVTSGTLSLGLNSVELLGDILCGKEGSFADIFGGEFWWNNYAVVFNSSRGRNTGYSLRYGVNISDVEQTESCENTYSHVLPYGKVRTTGGTTFNISAPLVSISETEAQRTKVFPLDCTDLLDAYTYDPGQNGNREQLWAAMTSYAQSYAVVNELGKIKIGISVTSRAELDEMSQIRLCDTVKVILDNFGTTATAKITEVTYDALLERWDKIVVGEPKITVADMILNRRKYVR